MSIIWRRLGAFLVCASAAWVLSASAAAREVPAAAVIVLYAWLVGSALSRRVGSKSVERDATNAGVAVSCIFLLVSAGLLRYPLTFTPSLALVVALLCGVLVVNLPIAYALVADTLRRSGIRGTW